MILSRMQYSKRKFEIADDYTWRLAVTIVALFGTTLAIAGAPTQGNTANSSAREEAMLKELARAQKKGAQATYLPLEYLAAFYEQQKQWANAAQRYGQLVALWTTAAGPDAVGTARFEDQEAMNLARLGEHAKAEELLSHALSVLRKAPEVDVVSRALVQADLGEVLAEQNKLGDAQLTFAEALPELERTVGPQKSWLPVASIYEDVLRKTGHDPEAAELSERIAKARSENAYMESRAFVRPKGKKLDGPTYPSDAKRLRVSGTVLLAIEVMVSGEVTNIHVSRPLGLGLDEEAARTVRAWKFEPAKDGDRIVPYFGLVEVQFNIGRT